MYHTHKSVIERRRLQFALVGFIGLGVLYLGLSRVQFGSISVYINNDSVTSKYQETLQPVVFSDNQTMSNSLKIMTWNLQGLMSDELVERTEAVISVIRRESPDAVFFQELVPLTFKQLSKSLEESYASVSGARSPASGYFVGIFFNKLRLKMKKQDMIRFSNSVMDRALLIVKLLYITHPHIKLALLTSHLESLPRFKASRIEQLKESFDACLSFDDKYNVIFGGDLNLEDGEEEGLVPQNVKDLWEQCGSQQDSKYTWDMSKNTNEQVPGVSVEEQPRRRYDRLYFRNSKPPHLFLSSFQLSGTSALEGSNFYPSDHWALVSTFSFNEDKRAQSCNAV